MIAYFDTSAFLKLVLPEHGREAAIEAWEHADVVVASAVIYPEARAATAAAIRHRRVRRVAALTRLESLIGRMLFVEPTHDLPAQSVPVREVTRMPQYDAVHLASAMDVEEDVVVVAADMRLLNAARAERLKVLLPN